MQAVLGRQKGGHGPRRSLRKPRKLRMRVRQKLEIRTVKLQLQFERVRRLYK